MKFLIDTNIFIPLEPASEGDIEKGTPEALEFARLVAQHGGQLYVHPAALEDIRRDKNARRKALREVLFGKYPRLPSPPDAPKEMARTLPAPRSGSNDWVDYQLLAALAADAIDILVTEDQRLAAKARRVGLDKRVATVPETLSLLRGLFDASPPPPPAVESVLAHELDEDDPFFRSFHRDYPGFTAWLRKCKRDHRQAWRIIAPGGAGLGAVCIIKREAGTEFGLKGKTLKICTFKVSESHRGFRFGELLLKTVFAYADKNEYSGLFLTAFEKHTELIGLIEAFGFRPIRKQTDLGERIFVKEIRGDSLASSADPLTYNVRFGPSALNWQGQPCFVIPIQPRYHQLLFPEWESQLQLMPGSHPFGNSIRKAYLSRSKTLEIPPGSTLLFYRSGDRKALSTIGIAEDYLTSSNPSRIARFVGKRTVYSFNEIQRLCATRVLAILFRQVRFLEGPIPIKELVDSGVLAGPPQSIVRIRKKTGLEWLQARLAT